MIWSILVPLFVLNLSSSSFHKLLASMVCNKASTNSCYEMQYPWSNPKTIHLPSIVGRSARNWYISSILNIIQCILLNKRFLDRFAPRQVVFSIKQHGNNNCARVMNLKINQIRHLFLILITRSFSFSQRIESIYLSNHVGSDIMWNIFN